MLLGFGLHKSRFCFLLCYRYAAARVWLSSANNNNVNNFVNINLDGSNNNNNANNSYAVLPGFCIKLF